MPKDQFKPDSPDRVFVAKHTVGSIGAGTPFSESEFRRLHPLPRDPAQAAQLGDSYHDDLISRLLASGAIEEAKEGTEPQPVPPGPAELNRAATESAMIAGIKEPQPSGQTQPGPAAQPQPKK